MVINNTEQNIIIQNNGYWNKYQGAIIPLMPPHLEMHPGERELRQLTEKSRPYFIRWTSDWDCGAETPFWFIIKDSAEDLAEYSSKVRNVIKKGISRCFARMITGEELERDGYPVYLKAFAGYNTSQKPMTPEKFRFQVENLYRVGEWQFWGLFSKEDMRMTGYSMNWIYENACEYKMIKLDPDYLKDAGGYLLIHEMNKHYLNDRRFTYVNDGARSLAHDSNVQEFLEKKFGFRKAYCRLHLYYRRPVRIAVTLLYPFRNFIYPAKTEVTRKVSILLRHEEIARGCMNRGPVIH